MESVKDSKRYGVTGNPLYIPYGLRKEDIKVETSKRMLYFYVLEHDEEYHLKTSLEFNREIKSFEIYNAYIEVVFK